MPPRRPTRAEMQAGQMSGARAGATRGGIGESHAAREDPAAADVDETAPLEDTPSSSSSKPGAASSSKPGASTSSRPSTSTGSRPTKTTARVTEQGAGLLVALFAWPLGVNLLKGGPPQMWGWIKAKFINEPYAGPGGSAPGAAGPGVQPGRVPATGAHRRAGSALAPAGRKGR